MNYFRQRTGLLPAVAVTVTAVVAAVAGPGLLNAAEPGWIDLQTIRVLPRSEEEIGHSYERTRGNSCEAVGSGEPLEITGFTPCLTDRDRAELNRGVRLLPSHRRSLFSIGLEVASADRSLLPVISGKQILRYLKDHYVAVQARVQKDPVTGELFLHHRPLAVTAMFGRGGLTQEFTDATVAAIRDFRSLGLFLPGNDPQSPGNLRTLVLVFRSVLLLPAVPPDGKPRLKSKFEYVFIRARNATESSGSSLVLHAFATSDHRQQLHYLNPWSTPRAPQQCGVRADVLFTEFSTLGLIPTKSATRNVSYDTRESFAWNELNQFARDQGCQGDALDNLNRILDGIIDGRLDKLSKSPH